MKFLLKNVGDSIFWKLEVLKFDFDDDDDDDDACGKHEVAAESREGERRERRIGGFLMGGGRNKWREV